MNYWKEITNDKWILDIVSGYRIEFIEQPVQFRIPKQISFSKSEIELVDKEVSTLLQKGAIEKVQFKDDQFVSNLFLVPKKDNSLRPVINLRQLNEFIEYRHFKQENLSYALDLIQKNDYCCSIDMKDAYFSISIHPDFQKYLCFYWKDNSYNFKVLPFGIASAP